MSLAREAIRSQLVAHNEQNVSSHDQCTVLVMGSLVIASGLADTAQFQEQGSRSLGV